MPTAFQDLNTSRILLAIAVWLTSRLLLAVPETPPPRTPWTTSRFKGKPDPPPPYRAELAFNGIKFTSPLEITFAPGSGRLFVAEQGGKIFSFPHRAEVKTPDLAIDIAKEIPGTTNVYGLTFHPEFAKSRLAFVFYALKNDEPDATHVSSFQVTPTDPPRFDPSSEKVLITWRSGGHNGGCMAFGPDGMLYISSGDAAAPSPPDPFDTGQNLTDLLSVILRIDVNREENGRLYAIPADNPFVGVAGARAEIWAYGFRNPWKMSFDPSTGDLLVGDVGWELWEMVYRVERGGNYGWSIQEGPQPVRKEAKPGPTPILPPLTQHPHTEAASVTGGLTYRGERLSELRGAWVYGDYMTGKIWALRHEGNRLTERHEIADTQLRVVAFGQDEAGELYFLEHQPTGQIYRLVKNEDASTQGSFPRRLSETGLFENVKDGKAAPGVIAYAVAAEPWADGAASERWLALPGDSRIDVTDLRQWNLPEGSVLAKTHLLKGPTARAGIRVETQVQHLEGGFWRPYTYAWDSKGEDAALVGPEGAVSTFQVPDEKGGSRAVEWRFPSRTECSLCHNRWVHRYLLGFHGLGLNRPSLKQVEGRNQIEDLEDLGVFSRSVRAQIPDLRRLADPYDSTADLNVRARSYLHMNCSHCHSFGAGGTALLQVSFDLPTASTQTVGVKPYQGEFGIPGASIITPGDPYSSILYFRMAKLGGGHMPRIGSREADPGGLQLIHDWIAAMPTASSPPSFDKDFQTVEGEPSDETVRELLSSTRTALALASRMGRDSLRPETRSALLRQARGGANADVRDLFERFLPPGDRVRRLGTSFEAAQVLSLQGNATHGRELFAKSSAAQCRTCHKAESVGNAIGPAFDGIGKKYAPGLILDHTMNPSREVAPEFSTHALVTKDGLILSGLLVKKTDQEVVLRDAKGTDTTVPAANVGQLERQSTSLMPESLLADLTAQEAADLIAYLSTLR